MNFCLQKKNGQICWGWYHCNETCTQTLSVLRGLGPCRLESQILSKDGSLGVSVPRHLTVSGALKQTGVPACTEPMK